MKIKMLTTKSGPIANENWVEGEIRTVCEDEGIYWIQKGIASLHEKSTIASIEKAAVVPTQKAVVVPPEVSDKGKGKGEAIKQPVVPSASSGNTVSSNKGPTWGTGSAK